MQFRILGPFEVEADGRLVALGRRQERCLLAMLLLRPGQVMPIDRMADLIWDGQPPDHATRIIQSQIARLRAALRAEMIFTKGAGYGITVDPDTVDAHRFQAIVGRARATAELNHRAGLLHDGLRLWRGPLLVDCAGDRLRDRLGRGLQELRTAATEEWLETALALGGHQERLADLATISAERPDSENVAGLYMLALYRCGRAADALRVFTDLRTRMADQHGLDPGHRLADLHTSILRDDPLLNWTPQTSVGAPTARVGRAGPPAPLIAATALPGEVGEFVGRHTELAALDALAVASDTGPAGAPIAILSGIAGIGKTAVAIQWAHQKARHYPDGQHYLDVQGYAERPPMAADMAAELLLWGFGVPPSEVPADPDRRLALYRATVAGRRTLIVLDNVRDAAQIRPLLTLGPLGMVVVTSRERLDSLVTHHFATPIAMNVLDDENAIALLARVGRLGPPPAASRPGEVARRLNEVAELCGRLPLALRIVACRIATHPGSSLDTLLADLRRQGNRLTVLETDRGNSGIRAAFALSYRILDPTAAALFRRFALHPGASLGLAASAILTSDGEPRTFRAITQLVDANLLIEAPSGQYAMHDLVHLYATELAGDDADRDTVLRRLVDWYLDTGFRAYARISSRVLPKDREMIYPPTRPVTFDNAEAAFAWFDAERANVAALVRVTSAHGWHRACWELAHTVFAYNFYRRRWTDWTAVFGEALAASEAAGDLVGQYTTQSSLGVAYWQLGDLDAAQASYLRGLTSAQAAGDLLAIGQGHLNLGGIYNTCGDTRRAEEHLRAALALPGLADHPVKGPSLFVNLAHLCYNAFRFDEAIEYIQRGLAANADAADAHVAALLHHGAAEVALQQRRDPDAAHHARRALDAAQQGGNRLREAFSLNALGAALARTDPSEARRSWQQSIDLARALQHEALATESAYWLLRPLPDTTEAWYSVELPRRFHINRL